jgi:NADH-quinone oxidoreductase subunit N
VTFSLDLVVLGPVLAPAAGALIVLVLDAVSRRVPALAHLAVAAVALALGLVATVPGLTQAAGDRRASFCLPSGDCLYAAGSVSSGLQLLGLGAAGVVLALAWRDWLGPERGPGGTAVQAVLLLSATAGVVAVVAARDLGTLLVSLELATLPTVGLVALERSRAREGRAVEGAVTLLTTSLVSFALLALGAALWVAATGSALLTPALAREASGDPARSGLLVLAAVLVFAGIGFKLSAAPFHSWTPLTYARAPLPVTTYLAGASKVAAAGALVVVVQALAGASDFALTALGLLAALSMTLGNMVALVQQDLVRLLAWSAVAQAGWVVLPLSVVSQRSGPAAAGYLTVYVLATLLAFAVVIATARGGAVTLEDHRGLGQRRPLVATALGLALLTLAGLPPAVIGLVAKVVALRPVAGEGVWWLAVVAALNVALGIAVYLRWLAAVVSRQPEDAGTFVAVVPRPERWTHRVVIGVLSLLLVAGSLAPVGLW